MPSSREEHAHHAVLRVGMGEGAAWELIIKEMNKQSLIAHFTASQRSPLLRHINRVVFRSTALSDKRTGAASLHRIVTQIQSTHRHSVYTAQRASLPTAPGKKSQPVSQRMRS